MAISQMNRVSLLAPEHLLDELLTVVQSLQQVEIINLNNSEQWENVDEDALDLVSDYAEEDALVEQEAITDLENRLHKIERTIENVEQYTTQPSFIQRMKQGKPEISYRQIEFHGTSFEEKEIVDHTQYLLERMEELEETIEVSREKYDELLKWKKLEITPNKLNEFDYINGIIGRVPSTDEDEFIKFLKENNDLKYETVFIDENDYGVIVFSSNHDQSEILNELKQYQFLPFKYTSNKLPKDQLDEYQHTIESAKKEHADILSEVKGYQPTLDDLKLQYEYLFSLTEREQAKMSFGRTKHLITVQGWIEKEHGAYFMQTIQEHFDNEVIVKIHDVNDTDKKKVPTKLKNNKLIRPFEMITNMYGTPGYGEMDPTPLVMAFYWVFFGMMIADLGYGLLLVIGAGIPLFAFNLEESTKDTVRLVFTLGWSVVLWGVIYGSFFGFTIEWMQLINLQAQVMEVMILSMAIGLIHMGIAFGINVYLKYKDKDFAIAYAEGLHWIIVILGIVLLLLGMVFPSLSNLSTFAGWMIGLSFVGMFVGYVIDAGSITGLGSGLLGLINAVSYFGDVISYTRLMALGLSGVSIGAAFNLIVAQFPTGARFTIGLVIFAGLHLFNMFLSVLTGGVHALRLIFVEFFGKFYTGNGHAFKPLKVSEKYVNVRNKDKMEEL